MFLCLYLGVKAQQYFVSSSHMFLDKKTFLKIWLDPGLNLTIFRGTGPNCYLVVLSFVLFFGSEEYNGEHRVPKKEL